MASRTVVSIEKDAFLIDGVPTYAGRRFGAMKIEGLLLNARLVQGVFDDRNPETRSRWAYPDGPWDAERNTSAFIAAMPAWREAGLLSFTINLQGGSPEGYSKAQPWDNAAFTREGEPEPAYLQRLGRILDAADDLGMAPILGLFYFGQDRRLHDERAVVRAVEAVTDWLIERSDRHVLIEIANEVDVGHYTRDILKAHRCHELIELVQVKSMGRLDTPAGRLLVSTSTRGGTQPPDPIMRVADFILLHGNSVEEPERIREMIRTCRGNPVYKGQPIVFNEDDHFAFDEADNNMLAAIGAYAGWGYFDYRRDGEGFDEGYQSVPVNWSISSERKRGFFGLLAKITGAGDDIRQPMAGEGS
ncbi:MAG: hypothetical protein R3F54_02900 [Alphaproteobacteria bacterium]